MNDETASPFRAQTIELFFDLVFVFTVTQLTHVVEHVHSVSDYLRALSILVLIWWMYGGYIWLTNHAHTPKEMRGVLVLAMIGFLIMSLAIPQSDSGARLIFGLAYLAIVVLHFAAFVWQGGRAAAKAMLRVFPFNLAGAFLVIVSGMVDAEWAWLLLAAPALLFAVVSFTNRGEGYQLDAGHFVERHGLLLIIVLGEIVIAVGSAMGGPPRTLGSFGLLFGAVGLIAALWWSYFDRDDQAAEHRMMAAPMRERTRMALLGYNSGHLFMIAGLILVAAGLKLGITGLAVEGETHGGDVAHASMPPGLFVFAGLSVYLAADVLFRWLCRLGPLLIRAVGAGLCFGFALLLPALDVVLVAWLGFATIAGVLALEELLQRRGQAQTSPR